MPSRRLLLARWLSRTFQRPMLARAQDHLWQRARVEIGGRVFLRGRAPLVFRSDRLGGVPVRRRRGARQGTLFYIHGGAFMFFSARSHQGIAARLAMPLGLEPVLPDYRRAPEHPFPAAIDDVTAAYRALVAEPDARPIVVAGESAGGGLALSLLHRILAQDLPRPAAVLAFSPWADLTLAGASLTANAETDAMLPARRLPDVAAAYLAGADPAQPDASPVFGRFRGAPPVLIQAARDEILFSDAETLSRRLAEQQVAVRLDAFPQGLHAFQLVHGWVPEATAAVDAAVAFAGAALGRRVRG
ncbi:alpha/beta hydrolase fold domain-containing protein [Rhodobacteraceae bacterium 2CG4]|uniref:Alpha/beta hydrolase fold domain-containing protein n=1 Tax=Halovulum marinum TaxID=2662447 RepID=A0A6L5Z0C5_9RHOB|nr:alpha/beta hydrolase [Halovulum marinum]MSU89560.1 alpha/beta hydrolase fold domain-containing protein [Halovulum marinum]